jgi:predicted metalloendopeptidase
MLKIRRAAMVAVSLLSLSLAAAFASAADGKPEIGTWGFDLTAIDPSVKPGDDFFRYAGGTWMKNTQIPAEKTSYGSFVMLRDKSEADVQTTIETNAKKTHAPGSVGQKVADFYTTFLDTGAIEAKGLAPAQPDLDLIRAAASHDQIAEIMAIPGMPGGPVGMGPGIDPKDPSKYVIDISQSGLGLPDRDYYLRDDKQFADIRAAYQAHIAKMLTMSGYADAEKAAADILALETRIATDSWENTRRRDPVAMYNPKTRAELQAFAPDFPWGPSLDKLGIPSFERFVVNESDAIQKLSALFKATPVDTWKAYLTFHYLDAYAAYLPKAFDEQAFAFNSVLSGAKEQRPRWKRAISALGGSLGEAVGQLYVADHFSPEAKGQMLQLVENLRAAYKVRIEGLDWMSADTKKEALAKLASFRVKIGYPDQWRDYSGFEVIAGDALGNARRSAAFEWKRWADRLDKPTDKDEWFMPPQTVNAYYNPVFNEIVFPAAILQAPFFDQYADPAVNYGAIGAVIGHEMGHGFDDQGSQFDSNGMLRNWWTPEDLARFKERTKVLGEQYGAFEPLPGIKVNGSLTMGENIGDLGGIEVAHEAYKISLNGQTPEVKDGFTGEQRFYLAFAQVWRSLYRDEAIRNQVLSDPHSPPEYRVNGVVPNVDDWYAAFNIQDGKLYIAPEKRVRIW